MPPSPPRSPKPPGGPDKENPGLRPLPGKNVQKSIQKPPQNHSKIDPETSQNDNQKNDRKKDPQNRQKVQIWSPNWVPGGGSRSQFSALFRLRASLGHLWEPKWSQDLPQEPPGPLRASIFDDFYSIFDAFFERFSRFGAHSWHGGGDWPAGQLDIDGELQRSLG